MNDYAAALVVFSVALSSFAFGYALGKRQGQMQGVPSATKIVESIGRTVVTDAYRWKRFWEEPMEARRVMATVGQEVTEDTLDAAEEARRYRAETAPNVVRQGL